MKTTGLRKIFVIGSLSIACAVSGCDSFNLLDLFASDKSNPELGLVAQKTTVNQDESVQLYPSGGTAPCVFAVIAEDLYYRAGNDFGYVADQVFTAQKAVGKVKVRVSDRTGTSVDLVITVRPAAPSGFGAATGTGAGHEIDLSWSYADTSYIGGYRIQSSTDASTYVDLFAPPASSTSYTDTALNQTKTYYYRIFARAGSYESVAAPVQSAMPN